MKEKHQKLKLTTKDTVEEDHPFGHTATNGIRYLGLDFSHEASTELLTKAL